VDRLLTPSKITAWLDCPHYLSLQRRVDAGTLTIERGGFGEMAQMLMDKGMEHELAVLEMYRREGKTVFEVPGRAQGEAFEHWAERIGNPLDDGWDVVYQMPFIHDGMRGIADFLVRADDGLADPPIYEPVDAKLVRAEAKPGHVLQLCFYADALAEVTGSKPEQVHLVLGTGEVESIRLADVEPYWRRLQRQLSIALDAPVADTVPEPNPHCQFCEFAAVCEAQWRDEDSLVYVAGLRSDDRVALEDAGTTTLAELADGDVAEDTDVDPTRLDRLVRQAALQITSRKSPEGPPSFELLAEPPAGEQRGFAALPEPDRGDVFLDFEGHPFWRPDVGLFFLLGLVARADDDSATEDGFGSVSGADTNDRVGTATGAGDWHFRDFWAHDRAEEAMATRDLIEYLTERRRRFPGMHVYHYNHTERSALERLTIDHGVMELQLLELIETGLFVDLYPIVKDALLVGAETYGLKDVERLTDYERGHDIDQGAGAVVEYDRYAHEPDPEILTRIARYNEDDVRATLALRDWLVDQRPADLAWRPAVFEPFDDELEIDERVERLHAFGPDTTEHLLGDLLGYWRREARAVVAFVQQAARADAADLLASPAAIGGLESDGVVERTGKRGQAITPGHAFRFPHQELAYDLRPGATVVFAVDDDRLRFATIVEIDVDAGHLLVTWNEECQESGVVPHAVVLWEWVPPKPKPETLCTLADRFLAGDADTAGLALLRRDHPRFVPGHGPPDSRFSDDPDEIVGWAPWLDRSYVAIQGPPGTGKTYTGARIVHALVQAGKRVGLTAMSHNAIDNLMAEVVDVFTERGDLDDLRMARRGGDGRDDPRFDAVEFPSGNGSLARGEFDVVAGTTWLFASADIRERPVDVLIVDEAGQLALADTLAASVSARNLILLGDPQQLPQVAQASHPGGSGASGLEHVLGDHVTIPADRGVLLPVTRRMHPDVNGFVSDVMYDDKVVSHESCEGQSTEVGTGLRWIRVDHDGCSTESPVEAAVIAATIADLIGKDWTDQHGVTRPIGAQDVIVVAPYNDQVRGIRSHLDQHRQLRGVEVGTVDRFQGREAAVVFFSMTTSSAEFMPRTADFLFSKNRLNVAISRARCLVYVVSTDALLDTRARDVEQMELISALCAFVERAVPVANPG
jgi:uncharacterized protein